MLSYDDRHNLVTEFPAGFLAKKIFSIMPERSMSYVVPKRDSASQFDIQSQYGRSDTSHGSHLARMSYPTSYVLIGWTGNNLGLLLHPSYRLGRSDLAFRVVQERVYAGYHYRSISIIFTSTAR
jgi:hypothetical protein